MNISVLIHAMTQEHASLVESAQTEVCSSIRLEYKDRAQGFQRALAMVQEFERILGVATPPARPPAGTRAALRHEIAAALKTLDENNDQLLHAMLTMLARRLTRE